MDDLEIVKKLIDGKEYCHEMKDIVAEELAEKGIVIVFGGSDDLMEFRGAIDDEIGAYEGTIAYLTDKGLFQNECDNDDCPHEARLRDRCATIKAIWGKDGISWQYETDIPHLTFQIMEDGEVYCIGIIFRLTDVKKTQESI